VTSILIRDKFTCPKNRRSAKRARTAPYATTTANTRDARLTFPLELQQEACEITLDDEGTPRNGLEDVQAFRPSQ